MLQSHTTSQAAAVRALRSGISWQRSMTWRWQDRAGVGRARTVHAERRTTSLEFLRWIDRLWLHRRIAARRQALSRTAGSVPQIICRVFGRYCSQALTVARCESGLSPYAVNGQYFGLFQMGSSERSIYGDGRTAYAEAGAAFRYFVASGRDWSPWACKPW